VNSERDSGTLPGRTTPSRISRQDHVLKAPRLRIAPGSAVADNLHAFDNADEHVRLYGSQGEPLPPFAPIVRYHGNLQELGSHMRSALAPVYDFRRSIEKVRDRILDRLEFARAA
jgi:hypothetical protein